MKVPASRSFPEAIPVRGSCGYLTGILLHNALNEPLCGVCVVAKDGWKPIGSAARRAELEAEVQAIDRENRFGVRRGGKQRRGDYELPVT